MSNPKWYTLTIRGPKGKLVRKWDFRFRGDAEECLVYLFSTRIHDDNKGTVSVSEGDRFQLLCQCSYVDGILRVHHYEEQQS